jgi:hypothetical protein
MTEMILRDKGITYEILQEKDLEETVALVSEVFTRGEPMTKALEITAKEFHYFIDIYCKKAVKEGLSVIAKDKDKIVGFIISEDFDSAQPEGIEKIDIKVVPWMALIDAVEKDAKSNKKEGELRFHMFLGGTEKQYENKHINTTMIEESLKLAKIKNFTSVMVEPTGFATQHMFADKFGFEQKVMIEYKTFLFEGKNVFKNIEGPVGLLLMEKRL